MLNNYPFIKARHFNWTAARCRRCHSGLMRNDFFVSDITIKSFFYQQGLTFSFQVVTVRHYEGSACQVFLSPPASKHLLQCFAAKILRFNMKAWREQIRWYCRYYKLYLSWVVSSLMSRFTLTPCNYHYKGQNKSRIRWYLWYLWC